MSTSTIMGNSSGKESRNQSGDQHRSSGSTRSASGPARPSDNHAPQNDGPAAPRAHRSSRNTRHELSFLGMGGEPLTEPRRETRPEREARRAEKDRVSRAKERERSLKEEGVDGGYLVTMGTYSGAEDFNKTIVRQLMVWFLRDLKRIRESN